MAFARSATGAAAISATCRHSPTGWPMKLGASFVALNPLHAIHNRRPFNTSPYLPNSVFYQNCAVSRRGGHSGFCGDAGARSASWRAPRSQREIADLRATEFVEYERVARAEDQVPEIVVRCFPAGIPCRLAARAAVRASISGAKETCCERFATYCALDEWIHLRNPDIWLWTEWPEPFRDPESAETEAFRKKHWRLVLFYQYLQWQIDVQLAARTAACARQRALHRPLS